MPVGFGSWGFKSPLAHAVAFSYSHPRRRRRGVVLLALLSVVVVVVVLVTSFRSDRRVLADYIDTAHQAAVESSATAVDFANLIGRTPTVDRQEFITTLAGLRATMSGANAAIEGVEAPTRAADAQARLVLASRSWLRGLDLIEGGLLDAADRPGDDVPAMVIERGIVELAVGDRSYEDAVTELTLLQSSLDVDFSSYPVVAFTPASGILGLIAEAQASVGLPLRRDAAITSVGFNPRRLGTTDLGEAILPLTSELVVTVTVLNQGNEALAEVIVAVTLTGDRAGAGAQDTRTIDRLVPGESSTFEVTFEVVPVVQYVLRVAVPIVSGDVDVENNTHTERFIVNEEG